MPPPLSIHHPPVQRHIRRHRTPDQTQNWLRGLSYNPAETMNTLSVVLARGSAHCLEGALAAAAILEHHGYPPLILDLESKDRLDHTLLLYRTNGRYGAVGKSRDIGLDGRQPVFRTIRSLVASYAIPYIDAHAEITGYGLLDLRTISSNRWRSSRQNVWHIEELLRRIPHESFRLPTPTVRAWRQKYLAFKQDHPHDQPPFYPQQETWLE